MPDSFPPPSWGNPPYDERDLDALLSGEAADIPATLRPLADALTALKGPPMLAELRDEAAIMAEFRALAVFGVLGPAHSDERAETLKLSALRPGPRPRHAARHRMRRPPNHRFGVFLTAAAAVGIVGAVTVTGNLPGPIQRLAHLSAMPHAGSSTAVRPTSPNLQDRSASSMRAVPPKTDVRPWSSSPSANASTLCRTLFSYFTRPIVGQQWRKSPAYSQLSAEVGGSDHILAFCLPYLKGMFPHGVPVQFQDSSVSSQQGSSNGSQGSDGNTAPSQHTHYPVVQGRF